MATYREMPFPAVLSALFGGDEVPVHLVFRLSDMPAGDFEQFRREWTEVSEERRFALVRHMADIAEYCQGADQGRLATGTGDAVYGDLERIRNGSGGVKPYTLRRRMQQTMTDNVGVFRTEATMSKAVEDLSLIHI